MANIKTIPNEATLKTANRIKNIVLASVIALFVIICVCRCFYSVDEQAIRSPLTARISWIPITAS